ncbi:MAG TPA: hypothetical protein VL240_05810 [Candidatus Binatia bacterium]|nr:hypothetical protein [Candidatus Binatia bacterium]
MSGKTARAFRPKGVSQAKLAVLTALFAVASCVFAAAQNITGTVSNGTTGKPAAADEVTLLSLSQGMQEIGSAKTDAQGRFSFPAPGDAQAPHIVRVTHQGVSYFPPGGPLMPGSNTAQLTVYDSAREVDGLSQTVEVDRLQSEGQQLQGVMLYALSNQSQPPRTLANDRGTFEVVLPEGAEIESAQAKGPGGQPIATEATAAAQKNHYMLSYPLRPGETQFQIVYHMPYSGKANFSPRLLRNVQHFVVMMPKSMSFTAKTTQQFQPMADPQSTIMVATNVKPGQDLSFSVAGNGIFPAENQQGEGGGAAMGGSQSAANDNRPGGGLGAPIDAPDPLHEYRAYILGAFALVLVMGGAWFVARSNRPQPVMAAASGNVRAGSPEAAAAVAGEIELTAPSHKPGLPATPAVAPAGMRDRNALLLEAMKEELFQLEIDRQEGRIDPEEYAKAKLALDETLRRALARSTGT